MRICPNKRSLGIVDNSRETLYTFFQVGTLDKASLHLFSASVLIVISIVSGMLAVSPCDMIHPAATPVERSSYIELQKIDSLIDIGDCMSGWIPSMQGIFSIAVAAPIKEMGLWKPISPLIGMIMMRDECMLFLRVNREE